jgi:hypothetical protein
MYTHIEKMYPGGDCMEEVSKECKTSPASLLLGLEKINYKCINGHKIVYMTWTKCICGNIYHIFLCEKRCVDVQCNKCGKIEIAANVQEVIGSEELDQFDKALERAEIERNVGIQPYKKGF